MRGPHQVTTHAGNSYRETGTPLTVNAYNLAILIGAAHGLMLSLLLLLSSRNRRLGNFLLAMLLIFYTMPVLKVILEDLRFFHSHEAWFFPAELLYGLGPLLYLYSKTVTDQEFVLGRRDLAHFLPMALELVYYLGPFHSGQTIHAFIPARDSWHLIWMIEQAGAIVSILIYLYLTNRLLWAYSKWVKGNFSDEHRRALRWLRVPVMLYSVFFALWLSLRAVDVFRFNDSLPTQSYYPLLLFLSFSTYWIGTRGYLETQAPTVGFSRDSPKESAALAEEPELDSLFMRLELLMSREKFHREFDLSLTELAQQMGINPRLLSKVINTKAKMNFYDFVNRYRVEEFKQRVSQPGPHRTLLDLAHDCGFGSKATFNSAFKKSTGLTPSQYRKKFAARGEPD